MSFVIAIFLISCSESNEKKEVNANETTKSETIQDENKIENKVENTEPLVIVVKDLKNGDVLLGNTVVDLDYVNDGKFTLGLDGELTLNGKLTMNQENGEIMFFPKKEDKKAIFKVKDQEYSLFLWTGMRNKKEFLAAISPEQIKAIESFEDIPTTIVIKNYKIFVSTEDFYIGADADFIRFE